MSGYEAGVHRNSRTLFNFTFVLSIFGIESDRKSEEATHLTNNLKFSFTLLTNKISCLRVVA